MQPSDKDDPVEKSRTQLKKEALRLQKTGEKLVALSDEQLQRIGLPAVLLRAIGGAKTMKSHGARRRQMQYIGSLMRKIDVVPIERAIHTIEQGAYDQARAFHKIEAWRDRLVGGDDGLMETILSTHSHVDRQRFGQLVRSARKEKQKGASPKSSRNLFRYLRELVDRQG
jgi:ribosome-associated protein